MSPELLQEIPTGGDPFLDALKWIAIAATLILVFGTSVMTYIKNSKQGADPVEHAKDDAEIMLYSQLQEQIRHMAEDVKQLTSEKNKLFEEWVILKTKSEYQDKKISELYDADAMIHKLRESLNLKDELLAARDAENITLMAEMMDLKDRIYHLEMRLTEDEKAMCASCPRKARATRKVKAVLG